MKIGEIDLADASRTAIDAGTIICENISHEIRTVLNDAAVDMSAVSHPKMLDIFNIRITVCTKIVYVANGVRVDRPPIRCRYVGLRGEYEWHQFHQSFCVS